MTGPEHYKKAEELLSNSIGPDWKMRDATQRFAEAQVHATLALAAATAMTGYGGNGMANDDFTAWDKACGVQDDIAVGGTA